MLSQNLDWRVYPQRVRQAFKGKDGTYDATFGLVFGNLDGDGELCDGR